MFFSKVNRAVHLIYCDNASEQMPQPILQLNREEVQHGKKRL